MLRKNGNLIQHQRTAQIARRHSVRSGGFSLIELCIVLAITVILAGIAVPQVMNTVYRSRVRDTATELSALVQQARITAEQKNIILPVYTGAVQGGAAGAFVPCVTTAPVNCPSGGNSTTYLSGDGAVSYAGDVTNGAAGSAPAGLSPGFVPAAAGTTLYFSSRGVVSTAAGVFSNGVILYITDSHNNWAAVSVSSIGRNKVWVWNGSNWN